MSQTEHVARMEKITMHVTVQSKNLEDHMGYLGENEGRIILTLRLLMSYIYIYIYIYMERLFLMFLDHTQRRTTVGRTPLDE